MSNTVPSLEVLRSATATRLVLNRPEKHNALNLEVWNGLEDALDAATHDDTRVVVLAGRGPSFAAGADVAIYDNLPGEDFRRFITDTRRIVNKLVELPKPVIAAVHGHALGGGFELALACDLIVAADNARLGLPEARLGLLPGGGGTQRLSRIVGRIRANELLMTTRSLTAEEALAWGVVNQVVPLVELDAAVDALVDRLCRPAGSAQARVKRVVRDGAGLPLPEALQLEEDEGVAAFVSPEGRAGVQEFLTRSS